MISRLIATAAARGVGISRADAAHALAQQWRGLTGWREDGLEQWSGWDTSIEQAVTLPASWYTNPAALRLEEAHVLGPSWQAVCAASRLRRPGDYVCGTLGRARYLLVRGADGELRAFHNVCRHHAAAVARGCGTGAETFECPYHSWTYDYKGRLVKATRLKGVKNFSASSMGLHPIELDTWGHLVFLRLGAGGGGQAASAAAAPAPAPAPSVAEWLGSAAARLEELGMADGDLVHVARREYELACNWKVFADNFLDGGYHVPHAHPALASALELSHYTNELHELVSLQLCGTRGGAGAGGACGGEGAGGALDRLCSGRGGAAYAFCFPNLCINRYGPWLDTNVVTPLGVDRCRVSFDWWLEAGALQRAASVPQPSGAAADVSQEVLEAARCSAFVLDSLGSSHQVQLEDIELCEAVQGGLEEPSYGVGRYAPGPEAPMFHFHRLLYGRLLAGAAAGAAL